MSDPDNAILRWELPSFEPPRAPQPQVDLAREEVLARDRGFQQGLAEGVAQGLAQAEQIAQRMNSVLGEMARPYQNLDQVVTQELVQMSMHIARQIIGRELSVDSSQVAASVTEALATLSTIEGEIEIHLNPVDMATIRELAPELLDGRSWKLLEDTDLLPGGCRLKTPVSYVDASVERQIEAMLGGLIQACEHTADD